MWCYVQPIYTCLNTSRWLNEYVILVLIVVYGNFLCVFTLVTEPCNFCSNYFQYKHYTAISATTVMLHTAHSHRWLCPEKECISYLWSVVLIRRPYLPSLELHNSKLQSHSQVSDNLALQWKQCNTQISLSCETAGMCELLVIAPATTLPFPYLQSHNGCVLNCIIT